MVDIFITICGEEIGVLQKTFEAVLEVKYLNKKIYVLDDKGVEEHRLLAESFGFSYLSRPNKGYMKKAGNIRYGYERSRGDFIIIFDADFAPNSNFIKELLPYMEDTSVGIVQSPQYFQTDEKVHSRSLLEYGASHVQEDFYRFVQVARDRQGRQFAAAQTLYIGGMPSTVLAAQPRLSTARICIQVLIYLSRAGKLSTCR